MATKGPGGPVIPLHTIRAVLKCIRMFFLVLATLATVYFISVFSRMGTGGALDVMSETPAAFLATEAEQEAGEDG